MIQCNIQLSTIIINQKLLSKTPTNYLQMKRPIQYQKQSKTISTSHSVQQLYPTPQIHSYHKYQSLLHYITSFINDFKFHMFQAKQLVYSIVGVNVKNDDMFYQHNKKHIQEIDCQMCQVEYMMYNCKKVRQDMIRILSMLRGYAKYSLSMPNDENDENKVNIKIQNNENYQLNLQNICPNRQKNNNQSYDDTGYVTFRQNINNKIGQQTNKFLPLNFGIIQEIAQDSMNEQDQSFKQKQKNVSFDSEYENNNEKQQYFERAFELMRLIKRQIPSQHRKIDQRQENILQQQNKFSRCIKGQSHSNRTNVSQFQEKYNKSQNY